MKKIFDTIVVVFLLAFVIVIFLNSPCRKECFKTKVCTMPKEFQQASQPIVVKFNQQFKIVLDSNPTTGYQWEIKNISDNKVVRLIEANFKAPTNDKLGAQGQQVWLFNAQAIGKTQIGFAYLRSWEKDIEPVKKEVFEVEVI